MKVINLLNKIANGEELPKKVSYNGETYNYVERNRFFAKYIKEPFDARIPYYLFTDVENIYDEIEIIEEDKKIEKLKISRNACTRDERIIYIDNEPKNMSQVDYELANKINEIINKLED